MFPILILWIHLMAAILWIGGMLFLLLVLKPVLRGAGSSSRNSPVLSPMENRFRMIRWVSLVTLLVTGLLNLLHEGGSARLESDWGGVLMVKLLFVAIVMGLSGVNDFILSAGAGTTPTTPPGRSKDRLEGVILVLSLFIVFIAVYLRQF